MVAFLANDRRAAVLALVLALVALIILGRELLPERRRLLTRLGLAVLVLAPLYLGAFWTNDALLGQPAQAIRSGFEPDERDFSSNAYREAEALNLEQTFRQNVVIGVGFGIPMAEVEELPDISDLNPWYLLVPHNTVLWLLSALGIVGFLAFWNLIAAVFVNGLHIARRLASAELRGVALFAVLATAAFLVIGYLDQGLFSTRLGLFVGVLLGALVRLPDIERLEAAA
jgi:O-antigen ligase